MYNKLLPGLKVSQYQNASNHNIYKTLAH